MFRPPEIEICGKCGERYLIEFTPQRPGFKWDETAYCPFCENKIYSGIGYDVTVIPANRVKPKE